MKRKLFFTLFAIVLVVTGAAFAQQQRNRTGTGTLPAGPQSVLVGTVVSFTAGAGQGTPTLAVRTASADVALLLGPFWFLQNAQFTAAAGDNVEATVIACADCPNGYAVVAIKNLTNGSSVTLRNADGLPLWLNGQQPGGRGPGMGRGMGPGNGSGPGHGNGPANGLCDGSGPDMTQQATISGSVKSFAGGAGAGRPTLVLETTAGDRTFIVAPYRAIRDAGLQFAPGAKFTITAAPTVNGEWVVIRLTDDATGAELVLRNAETGFPIGGRRHP